MLTFLPSSMPSNQLPVSNDSEQQRMKIRIALVQQQLEEVNQQTLAFEAILRTRLSDLIVEANELHVLYKAIKKAKKLKRLEQKKRGKNYKAPSITQTVQGQPKEALLPSDQQERKKLYREALLHVHPDKFSMNAVASDTATEVTTRLIEIYQSGSLETLRAYHAHIFQGHANLPLRSSAATVQVLAEAEKGNDYMQLELDRLESELTQAKKNQLCKVMLDYKDPLTFVDELKAYYEDRIKKLKKRTRKGL